MILTLSKKATIDLMVNPEVTGQDYFNAHLKQPMWPQGNSGITFGFGYDIGTVTPNILQHDWVNILTPEEIGQLQKYCGKTGPQCKDFLPISISVSWENALKVFYNSSLKDHARMAANVYAGLDKLHPYEQTAIVAIVYNRGASVRDKPGSDRRKEMFELMEAIRQDNDSLMANLIRHMKRLWVGKRMQGILDRLDLDAKYVEMVDTPIPEQDKLLIEL